MDNLEKISSIVQKDIQECILKMSCRELNDDWKIYIFAEFGRILRTAHSALRELVDDADKVIKKEQDNKKPF